MPIDKRRGSFYLVMKNQPTYSGIGTHVSPETAQKTWAERAQLMAANIAVKGLIAIGSRMKATGALFCGCCRWFKMKTPPTNEPTFDENQRRAFTEAMREYSRFV